MAHHFIFLFVDGVGIGEASEKNPFFVSAPEYLPFYNDSPPPPNGVSIKKIDAILGVEGIPQSASGQTSLFTGENAQKHLNSHKDSYPNRELRKIIYEKNILSRLKEKGFNAVFVNAYPVFYLFFKPDHLQLLPTGELYFSDQFPPMFRRRISVTSCMMLAARQVPFNDQDILEGRSIFQEYSNRFLVERGINLPVYSPEKAAEILFQASLNHDFILYEYFQTDIYGHRHEFAEQVRLISDLNRLTGKLVSLLDPSTHTLLLTSDHGNIEDSSTRGHTLNPVPLLTWGNRKEELNERIQDLTHVTPTVVNFLSSFKTISTDSTYLVSKKKSR